MILSKILEDVEYKLIKGSTDVNVENLIYDSRKAAPGSCFIAIRGAVSDAHKYLNDVSEKGAAVLVVEYIPDDFDLDRCNSTIIQTDNNRSALAFMSAAWFSHPAKSLKTIGITGTKGKTTTTYMVKSILENSGIKTGLIGTIETIIGDEHIPSVNTTPESYIVQEYFRRMVDEGIECVVMEVSSQALKLNRVDGFTFDFGIFTNLEPDHIGPNEHENFEDYLYCKSLLFSKCKQGIFNADDNHFEEILKNHTCNVETYGMSEGCDYRAEKLELKRDGNALGISYHLSGLMDMDVMIDIPGKFSVYNSLTAISICRHFGVSEENILSALKNIHVRGRLQTVNVSDHFSVMVDYAHNAMSLNSLLSTLKDYNPPRLVCLFGCGGNRSRDRRFEMGEISSKLADLTIVTSDNPRFERPEDILNDIVTGVKKADGEYITIIDRREAIYYALDHALEGDVIVVAGKGHEDYQEIEGKKYHMDDAEIIMDWYNDHKSK
jgi:UDP-N-acetylmuramoyl-L-alanyl-D-glutamate--2,6-diaminopimelate ligase